MANKRGIARDVLGELLETGKQTVKAGGKAAGDIAGQTAKTIISGGNRQLGSAEKGQKGQMTAKVKKQQKDMSKMSAEEQIKKMADLDKRRAKQGYEEIQRKIQVLRKKRKAEPRKYETGKKGFDEEQGKDPDSFWDKMKKKKEKTEKDKKRVPLSVQKGKTSTEIRRGSG